MEVQNVYDSLNVYMKSKQLPSPPVQMKIFNSSVY